jgi:hypothetical protein
MKAPLRYRLGALLALCCGAAAGGCQSSALKSGAMGKREMAKFQEQVAKDPFPSAQQRGLMGN